MPKPAILCVDDESTVLTGLKEQLRRRFGSEFLIEVASSGEAALEIVDELLAERRELPVVIADYIMPGIRGDELLVRIHERLPQVRKIMLTGQADADAVGRVVNDARLYRYLSKPWEQEDLLITVREAAASFFDARALLEQQRTMKAMYDLALDLAANMAEADRYPRLLANLLQVLPEGPISAAILGRDADQLRVLVSTSDSPARRHIPLTELPEIAAALDHDHPQRLPRGGASRELVQAAGWGETGAVVGVPLRIDDQPIGLITLGVDSRETAAALPDHRLMAIAALAAASLRTASQVDAMETGAERRRRVVDELQRRANERHQGPLIGTSAAAATLRSEIRRAATTDRAPVLLVGPRGSGREAAARAIHGAGDRPDGPFIVVDCALLDSTDALAPLDAPDGTDDGASRVALARGGTLFLSALERLSRSAQLRILELLRGASGGDDGVPRIMASARRAAPALVEEGVLEPALGELLGQVVVQVPPLRERLEDIPALVTHILEAHAARIDSPVRGLSPESLERLGTYRWPGNIAELGQIVERVATTGQTEIAEVDEGMLDGGATAGSYRLTSRLGAGGMGEVWRARHRHLVRPAAVKLIRTETLGEDDMAIRRFLREAQATAQLRSPHTVELYDFGLTDVGEPYYVMELLTGLDLAQMVRKFGPLPAERVVHLLGQACLSLQEAHEAGLVHRDIKPANLYACRLGPHYDFLKVLDFGMVSAPPEAGADPDDWAGDITRQQMELGVVRGTPSYMAPEQTIVGPVDAPADLYALGCVAFFLLTGSVVFPAQGPRQQMLLHLQQKPKPPSQLSVRPVPEALDALVLWCLRKRADDRPSSAAELADALATIPFDAPWTQARARQWWELHDEARGGGRGTRPRMGTAEVSLEDLHTATMRVEKSPHDTATTPRRGPKPGAP